MKDTSIFDTNVAMGPQPPGQECMMQTSQPVPSQQPQAQAMAISPALAAICADELRKRLPLLLAACTARDAAAARAEAHAMRGVAANFGLPNLAQLLPTIEAAAKQGDLTAAGPALAVLPQHQEAELSALIARAR